MQPSKPTKRSLLGTVAYVLVVCAAYGVARAVAALAGWTDPWVLVILTLASFIGLVILLAVAYDRIRKFRGHHT